MFWETGYASKVCLIKNLKNVTSAIQGFDKKSNQRLNHYG